MILIRQTLSTIHQYMKKRQVMKSVQIKVRKYLESSLDNDSLRLEDEKLIELLSDNLKQELILNINGKILNKFHIFHGLFSSKFLMKVAFLMKQVIYGANEDIFKVNLVYHLI